MSEQHHRLPYYASLRVREHDRVEAIRDEVWERLDPPSGYEKSEPHITIHPGFTCEHGTASRIAGVLAYVVGHEIEVTGLSFWPSPEEPMVVKLDLDADLGVFRQTIEGHVRADGGTIDREPVPAHITLFKSGDAGEEPASLLRGGNRRLESIEGEYDGWSVEVAGYSVKRRG